MAIGDSESEKWQGERQDRRGIFTRTAANIIHMYPFITEQGEDLVEVAC